MITVLNHRTLFSALVLLLAQLSFAQQDRHPAVQPLGAKSVAGDFTPRTVRYDLMIHDTIVNYTGRPRPAYAVNGQIPMPTLEFTLGDTALIVVTNAMKKEETSLHWHGIILPNQYDGVPYLTTAPIRPGETHTYKFPIVQTGTYWYHSHTDLQEQAGMHGAFIIHEREDPDPLPEQVWILSDWTDMAPAQVHRRLRAATDWFSVQKQGIRPGITQSYFEAIRKGHFGTKLTNEFKRMHAMDVSDVFYDRMLSNGVPVDHAPRFKGGDRVRVRIINGGASSYFWIHYAGGKITVVASDGIDVEPVEVDRFIMGVAETYDIIVTIPADSTAFELVATAEDRTRSTSLWLGNGIKQLAQPLPPLNYFEGMKMMNGMMRMDGRLNDMGMNMSMQRMDMNTVMYPEITGAGSAANQTTDHSDHAAHGAGNSGIVTLNYGMLRATENTALPPGPMREFRMELTGNMDRYVWAIDNRTVSETDRILIRKGENVRIILFNNSMMRHPMHMHGHFFRVINGHGERAPLKNVLDIMPMETDTIEFAGTENGDWFFHCHILYHMMAGMGRVFTYENSPPNPQFTDPQRAWRRFLRDDRSWHFMAFNDVATNGNDGEAMLNNKRLSLQAEWRLGYTHDHGQEVEGRFGRYFGRMQWLFPYVGYDWRSRTHHESPEENLFGQRNTKDARRAGRLGFQYVLPMLIVFDAGIDTDGMARITLMREDIALTPRARMDLMWNTDTEHMIRLRYILSRYFSATSHYDSDMGWGVGVGFTY
jgi:FtsP/CotA-like multicopper oxidase with cupredoxin domain